MTPTKDWNEDEDNFDLTLSQRTEELYRIPNREPDEEGLIEVAVLPLRDLVVFPRMVSPIFVGREGSLLAVQEAQNKEQTVIGLTQHDPDLDNPGPDDFLLIGVEMAVGRLLQMPDGSHSALGPGRGRGGGVAAAPGGRAWAADAGRPPRGDRRVHPYHPLPDGAGAGHPGAADCRPP